MTDDKSRSPFATPLAVATARISPAISAEIEERARQNRKWGQQDHPDGTGPTARPLATTDDEPAWHVPVPEHMDASATATVFQRRCEYRFDTGVGTWADILLEEVMEALAESEPRRLHAELIQVAAVATQWADAIQRRGGLQ